MESMIPHRKGLLALSPLMVFLSVYFLSSLLLGDFYAVPVSAAFLLACVYAVCIAKGSIRERVDCFSRGAGHPDVLMMIWIFILAGAFAGTARDIGAVDATVNATLGIIHPRLLYAGIFLTACFISMSVGTSVGTIVALAPIGNGIAAQIGCEPAFMAAIVVGGAFFGDNLSFISDTTIAATRAAGCEMRDKFRVNILIIAPAVLVVTAIYIIMGRELTAEFAAGPVQLYKMLPYLVVIVLAMIGRNIMIVLLAGIAVNAVIGFASGAFTWGGWLSSVGGGIAGMNDLIVVTLLAGGLLEVIRRSGGLDYLIQWLSSGIRGKKGAQFSIAALVSLANVFTANNTIAIITTGGIAKDISDRFGVDPRKTASLLDTFSCLVQGLIPYGAQILMASGLCAVAPTAIIPYLFYPVIMGCFALLSIALGYPRRYS